MNTTQYTALKNGNWNDPDVWDKPLPMILLGMDTVNIQNGIEVTIPTGLEVSSQDGLIQILGGGTLIIEGSLNITIQDYTYRDHCINVGGTSLSYLTIGSTGKLIIHSQGAASDSTYYPVCGVAVTNGVMTNNGTIDMTCQTVTNPIFGTIGRGYGIILNGSASTLNNSGTININSINTTGDGNGPTFGIYNTSGVLNNYATGKITSVGPAENSQGGGTIYLGNTSNFNNAGSFANSGQFWSYGNLTNTGQISMDYPGGIYRLNGAPATISAGSVSININLSIAKGRPATQSTAQWSDQAPGPMCGNSQVVVASDNSYSWYSDPLMKGLLWKNNDSGFSCLDIASAGYSQSIFVAVGNSRESSSNELLIYNSTSGLIWSKYRLDSSFDGGFNAVAFGSAGFVAVGETYDTKAGAYALGGMQGTSWSYAILSTIPPLKDIAFGNNIYVAVTLNSGTYSSSDGKSWNKVSSTSPHFICFCSSTGQFLGLSNAGEIFTSTNGNWSSVGVIKNGSTVFYISNLMWSNEAQLFIAVGCSGPQPTNGQEAASSIFASMDGINWTTNLYDEGFELFSIGYGLGVFTAAGYNQCLLQITPTSS